MCDNGRPWMYNLVLVAVWLFAVTAPLIQHVACVANGVPTDTTAGIVKSLPLIELVKRDATDVVGTGNTEANVGLRAAEMGDVDFDAYVNDFNMQDEASIPEDILDQQHIRDENEQYATESEATDIIFESEGPVPENRARLETKSNNSNHSHGKAYKKINNIKREKNKAYVKNFNSEKYLNKREEYYDDKDIVGEEPATEDDDTLMENMDIKGESDVYKIFERKKSKQHQQQTQHRRQQEQNGQKEQKGHQQQEQSPAIAKLNERKFNKVVGEESEPKGEALFYEKTPRDKKMKSGKIDVEDYNFSIEADKDDDAVVQEAKDAGAVAPIGDIEDNFHNENGALAAEIGVDTVVDDKDDYEYVDRDKSVATTTSTTDSVQRSISVNEAMGQVSASTITGRKNKRFNRVRTFNSGDGDIMPTEMQLNDKQYKSHHMVLMDDKEKTDKNNNHQKREQSITAVDLQNDYAIKNYGTKPTTTKNGSNISEDTQNTSGQQEQQELQHNDNRYSVLVEENAKNGETRSEHATLNGKTIEEGHQGQQQKQYQKHQEHQDHQEHQGQAKHATSASAFEQHKARRRNNRRYGHKIHKKRYKDYLRFAMTPIETTPTTKTPIATRTVNKQSLTAMEKHIDPGLVQEQLTPGSLEVNGTNAAIAAISELNHGNQKQKEMQTKIVDDSLETQQRLRKLKKYAKKIETENSRQQPASPIFVIANRKTSSAETRESPSKPFYEGQINYYLETKDDEQTGLEDRSNVPTDESNWYRRVGPVLRNGIKTSIVEGGNEPPSEHRRNYHQQQQQQNQHHLHHHHHHHHQHHSHKNPHDNKYHQHHHHRPQQLQHQHEHHAHSKHQQINKHYQSVKSNPYQRKILRTPTLGKSMRDTLMSTPIPPPSYKPHAGAMQELGHQITEMEELERYYAKWPHLARVQLQVYDEHFRELHPELYPDYDQDYESAAELEEAQNSNSEDANLPPYIKKYNRRNKQLLNLLEGTLPPPTKSASYMPGHFSSLLQPGPHESSGSGTPIRIDDDYMKEKRRRYHNRYGNNNNQHNGFQHDLFAQQRSVANANDNVTKHQNSTEFDVVPQKLTTTPTVIPKAMATTITSSPSLPLNKIPEEDISITGEEQDESDWQEEIETKSNGNGGKMTGNVQMTWQIEKLTTPSTPVPTSKPKAALFRLPSYPAISGTYIGKPRSRSAQFAPSTGGSSNARGNSFINMHRDYHNFEKARHMPPETSTVAPESPITSSGKTINSFVYHRVVDSAPRFVGTGPTGLKQRLPFVAITDRRLETAKKTLMEHKQDLEQNFYPLP